MKKLKLSLCLAAIFIAGFCSGALVAVKLGRNGLMPPPHFEPEWAAARWQEDLRGKLDLTPTQMQEIKPILTEAMATFKKNLGDQILGTMDATNAHIAAHLTAEQQPKFIQLTQKQRAFIMRALQDAHPPMPPTPPMPPPPQK